MMTQFQRNSDRLSKWLNGLTEHLKLRIAVPAVMTTLTAQTMPLLFGYAIKTFSNRINSTAIRCLTRLICLRIPILCRANGSCLFISVRKLLHIIFYLSKQTGSKPQVGIDPVFKMERKLYAAFNIFSINIP